MTFRELLTESKLMTVFKETDSYIIYSSPGPMKVKGNMENSIYQDSNKKIKVPTDEAIKQSLERTADDFKNTVWYEPGGYALWMTHYFKSGGVNVIYGRPNNARGASILLEVNDKGRFWFDKQVKNFNKPGEIREYLKKFDGKPIEWLTSKREQEIKDGKL